MRIIKVALFAIVLSGLVASTEAAVTDWTVQSASSSLTLSGSLSSGGSLLAPLVNAGPGSLVTRYQGTITTQQTEVIPGVAADIQFLSASITANNNGNWDPLPGGNPGVAPGNYGADLSGGLGYLGGINAALRDLTLNLISGVLPLSGSPASQFFSDTITAELLSGALDFRGTGPFGSALGGGARSDFIAVPDSFSSNGVLNYGPTITTLIIPIQFDFTALFAGGDTTATNDDIGEYFTLTGNIVATAPTESVPEANSLALLGLAGSVVGFMGYRRKRLSQVMRN